MAEIVSNKQTVDEINERLPLGKLSVLGIQHVLAMYAGSVLVPLILGDAVGLTQSQVALLISADLFACGVATLIQVIGIGKYIGIRLPIVLGCSFTTIAPMIMIAKSYDIQYMFGAIIGSGIIVFILSLFMEKLLKFFPRVVTGTFVTIIGLTLAPVAISDLAGGEGAPSFGALNNIFIGLFVLIVILLVNKFFKGFIKAISVLIGIISGTILASFFGMVNFNEVTSAKIVHIVTPFSFGVPKFSIVAILILSLFSLVNMIESVGMFSLVGEFCNRKVSERDITNGLRAEGIAQIIGGIFNSFPYVTFSENAGVMTLTGVKSRFVIVTAGIILVILSIIPKFAALATIIPSSVLGGAMVAVFGMITVAGIKMLSTVDLSNHNNLLIIAISMGLGIGVNSVSAMFAKMPQIIQLLFSNGIFTGCLTAVILNLLLNTNITNKFGSEKPLSH